MPYAENEGAKIYWDERGEGEPLLLIMGLGSSSGMWYRLVPELAMRYRTIFFDNRGAGQSEPHDGPYSIATLAGDAAAVMDAAGVECAHVFGFSMGGFIAQELALHYPERVQSLILASTACGGEEVERAAPEVFAALQARGVKTTEEAFWLVAPYNYDPSTVRARLEEDLSVTLRAPIKRRSYMAQLQAILSWAGTHSRLNSLRVPTLVIHGANDVLVPTGNGRILARVIPNADLVILPRAGHRFMTDQPEAAAETILSFLDRQRETESVPPKVSGG